MTAELRFFWARLNSNYWFYPALFSVLATVLAFAMVWLDRNGFAEVLNEQDWLVTARPKGASDMLTIMAGSLIGVASTVFSITIVAVSYVSGTYGPRLLTNFMADRGNQLSLATFIGSFVYALVVLRSVRTEDETAADIESATATTLPGFTPQLSLLVAYLIMAVCIMVLVFFLNHIPSSIRINKVLEGIGRRLLSTVQETYPLQDGVSNPPQPMGGTPVLARDTGYVQLIDFADLIETARTRECTLSLRVRTGDFVHRGLPLLDVYGVDPNEWPDELPDTLCENFTFGAARTPEQDPQFLIDELVEIGLRALSPGINDPFTAITAIHWIGAATADIGGRDLRKNIMNDPDNGTQDCPVIPLADDFPHYLKRGFGSLRSAVASAPIAAEVMLDALSNAATAIDSYERQVQLREQGEMLANQVREVLVGPDLTQFEKHFKQFRRAFWTSQSMEAVRS